MDAALDANAGELEADSDQLHDVLHVSDDSVADTDALDQTALDVAVDAALFTEGDVQLAALVSESQAASSGSAEIVVEAPSQASLQLVLGAWSTAVQKTLEALGCRAESLRRHGDDIPDHGGNMSLVEIGATQSVELVAWQKGFRRGKTVPLEGNSWRYVVGGVGPWGSATLDLTLEKVVIADCGIRMDKDKYYRRPLADPCVHLKLLWEVGMCARVGSNACLTPCMYCNGFGAVRCAVCLLAWHVHCAQNLKLVIEQPEHRGWWRQLKGAVSQPIEYPEQLLPQDRLVVSLCAICKGGLHINEG